jgi:hypothetical protein
MTQNLRVFNEFGLQKFRDAYQIARESNPKELMNVEDLINDPNLTVVVSTDVDIKPIRFKSWFECGQYFHDLFATTADDLREHGIQPVFSMKLWAWLSAVWSEVLQHEADGITPAKKLRYGHVGEEARWIYEFDKPDRWYRHLLAAPYRIYEDFSHDPNGALILLDVDLVHPNSRRLEVICGSPNVYAHKSLVSDLSKRFEDTIAGRLVDDVKKFEGREKGSFDRIVKVFNQLMKNYDLHQLTLNQIRAKLLNEEFEAMLPS